ncbi:MAG: hypothetical protein Q7P63_14185 [Verrucomicrobiota bacterium JB022]|nr:hypothetical protein [Verrucomicrobiota bacterium JB022]
MNKFQAIMIAALGSVSALSAQSVDNISVSTTFAFENSYVFRGAQLAEETFMPAIDFSADNVYFGVWGALPVTGAGDSEVDIYGGYGFELSEIVSLDVGGTYYAYPDSEDFENDNTFEIYAGASFDVLLSPAVYVFYDFDLENFTIEASAGYSYALTDSLSADASVFAGWVDLGDAGSDFYETESFDDYWYYGVSAALSYALAENASLTGYVNYSGSNERQMYSNDKSEVWYGVSVTTGF